MMSTLSRLCVVALYLAVGSAQASDLHALWDGQCGGCHGHAGDFARQALDLRDGVVFGRASGQKLDDFLVRHNGGYSPAQIAALADMLAGQMGRGPEFRTHCGGCHDTAAQLVRDWVVRRDGVLVGLASGLPLTDFLRRHGGADDASRAQIIQSLNQIETEINHR